MNRPSRDNVLNFRAKALPVVVTMPSRIDRAEGRGAALLQMPARFSQGEPKKSVVLSMPSRCAQHRASSVIEMPAPAADSDEAHEAHAPARSESQPAGFGDALRMTLVALFALLGWPKPTHGKDPGAAGAKPCKLELLDVFSRLQIPAAPAASRAAAQGAVLQFPQPEIDAGLARAA